MLHRPTALGRELRLSSLHDVNAALHELRWLGSREKEVAATTQPAIAKLQKEAEDKLKLDIDGEQITVADRAKRLETAIEKWCRVSLNKHLVDDKKSIDLPHGRVGKKNLPDAVGFREGFDDKKVIDAISQKAGLITLLEKTLATALNGLLTLSHCIRLKPELDKTALKKALGIPRLATALEKFGLKLETNRETYVIEPGESEVSTPAA